MSEFYRAPKLIGLALAAGIGASSLTGCGGAGGLGTWEVGVVCAGDSRAQIGNVDNDPITASYYSENDGQIDIACIGADGVSAVPQGMELTKGDEGAIINNSKEYSDVIRIQYDDQVDGYEPTIDLSASTGTIVTDNVKIKSAAIVE